MRSLVGSGDLEAEGTLKRNAKWLFGLAAVGLSLFAFGFILFAQEVTRAPPRSTEAADGIVVLTGGRLRIKAGLNLLAQNRAGRLLITGVNRKTTKADLIKGARLSKSKIECCVDLGYEALNTHGNALETLNWVREHGFKSLIVVTASYHMRRSLMEMENRMPNVRFIPHPVVPPDFREKEWWLNPGTARVLLSEYAKLYPAAVGILASWVLPAGKPPETKAPPHTTSLLKRAAQLRLAQADFSTR